MKSSVVSIFVWSIVVLLLVGLFVFLLLRGLPWKHTNWNFGAISQTYKNAEKYTAGDTTLTSPIRALDVHWVSGEVHVVRSDGDVIRVYETDTQNPPEQRLHWWLDGDTLRIQFCESKVFYGLTKWGTKILTVEIPSSMSDALKIVDIEGVSADISVRGFELDTLDIDGVSGDIALSDLIVASVDLETVSGDIGSERCIFTGVTCETTSGDVRLEGAITAADMDSVSGDLTLQSTEKLQKLRVDTTSGDIRLTLPVDEDGFTMTFDTVSGDLSSNIPMTREGKKYTCGRGTADYRVDSVSGDIHISSGAAVE